MTRRPGATPAERVRHAVRAGHARGVVAEVTFTGAARARDVDPPTGEQLREAVRHEHDRVTAACRPHPRHPVP
ncbi:MULTISPECIES: hypothetical protein [unclassified Streptomyces]|uniref:hypothetical protein n=1 Tax=unclassified Streptomyces TaxID=2593676 RepID=UPI001CBC0227|nr:MULTISPECIES: hypothetical protein [unclassified Streptomyces]WPO75457.1 hypothetical protein R9806_35100 [Streptomyces sp. KN37]